MVRRNGSRNGSHRVVDRFNVGVTFSDSIQEVQQSEQTRIAMVFVGGSGKKTFKMLLAQWGGVLPENVSVVVFDSDRDLCGVPAKYVVTLDLPQSDYVVEHRGDWPTIDQLLPGSFRPGRVTKGSKMKRMITASIIMPFYSRKIRREIRRRLIAPLLRFNRADGEKGRNGRPQVKILYVTSLGGGFGSGTRDWIPAIIRDEVRLVNETIKVNIECHAFTSSVHVDVLPLDWQKWRAAANEIAWFREFEAGYRDAGVISYDLMGMRPFKVSLIDTVTLYDRTNEFGHLLPDDNEVYAMAATNIRTQTLASLTDSHEGHLANINGDGDECLAPHATGSAPYGSAVAHRLVFPRGEIRALGILAAEQLLLDSVFRAKCPAHERDSTARTRFLATGAATLANRVQSQLNPRMPEIPTPRSRNDWLTCLQVLRQIRRDFEDRDLPRLERQAAERVPAEAAALVTEFERLFEELITTPSKHSPADVAGVLDAIVGLADNVIARWRRESAAIDLQNLVRALDQSLAQLEDAVQTRPWAWLPGSGANGRAWIRATNDLVAYVRNAQHRVLLECAAQSLARSRETLLVLRDQAKAVQQVGQASQEVLVTRVRQVRGLVGRHQTFERHVVDATWADRLVTQALADVDWAARGDEIVGKALSQLGSSPTMEEFLNTDCAEPLAAVLEPWLAKYHVLCDDLVESASNWLAEVMNRAAPQFPFSEAVCGEECQTYYHTMLAVGSKQVAQERLDLENLDLEAVETGDADQLVFTAHRRSVPIHAAIGNIDVLQEQYDFWVRLSTEDPQAEVHSNQFYAKQQDLPDITRTPGTFRGRGSLGTTGPASVRVEASPR